MPSEEIVNSVARSVLAHEAMLWETEAKKDNIHAVVVMGVLEHCRSEISRILREDFDIYGKPKLKPEPEFDADEPDPSYKTIGEHDG